MLEKIFPENNQRVINQKQNDITVIIGNPPYSAKQENSNDNNQNLKYQKLDEKIANSYAKYSTATNKSSLYDSYIRAIRWASDRIKDKGIVCFVTNGSFLDSNSADGLRKCLVDNFTSIYYFNLRGNGRTSGETCRKEGHPLFAALGGKGGSLAPIAITVLIKNPDKKQETKLFYHDIGDYLKRSEKLDIIKGFGDVSTIPWSEITPNDNYDWINQRNDDFESFISLGDKKDATTRTIFDISSNGLQTNRDSWAYNFSNSLIFYNMKRMIEFYNSQLNENEINHDPKYISWTRGLKTRLIKKEKLDLDLQCMRIAIYRPYCKEWLYFSKYFNEYLYQMPKIFPNQNLENLAICVTGIGATKEFSALITNTIPNLHFHDTSQCFPLYTYEKQSELGSLFATATTEQYTKKENIPDSILKDFQKKYQDKTITKTDIFYYIYGVLHSPEYKQRFAADLKKMLPRIP
ncbi:MAG: type ISP restriction/modification enzyme, partial [Dolichospermum sp.]